MVLKILQHNRTEWSMQKHKKFNFTLQERERKKKSGDKDLSNLRVSVAEREARTMRYSMWGDNRNQVKKKGRRGAKKPKGECLNESLIAQGVNRKDSYC